MSRIIQNNRYVIKNYKLLYDNYYNSLCVFAFSYLNDIDVSKDVVQEVFIKLWEKEIEFQDQNKVKSYMYKAVRNTALDYLKSKHYQINSKDSIDDLRISESDSFFYKEVIMEEASIIINKALNTLPNRCKQIIDLNLKGLKNFQISEELEISINTVKAQKRIAYAKLRQLFKEYYLIIAYIFTSSTQILLTFEI